MSQTRKTYKDGTKLCGECQKEYIEKNKQRQKFNQLKRLYNLSAHEYLQMLEDQNYKCAICNTSDWGKPSPFIDHDHETGKVRGLLCNLCNAAIGFAKEDIHILSNMIVYLNKHRS